MDPRREAATILRAVRSAWTADGIRAFPVTITATALVLALHIGRALRPLHRLTDAVSAVRQTQAWWLILLRTPLSLFAPAPMLPLVGALAQVLVVVALAEVVLGPRATLIVGLGTQVVVNLGVHAAFATGHPSWFGAHVGHLSDRDTGPSAAVLALAMAISVAVPAIVLGALLFAVMVAETTLLPDMAGHEHLVAMALAPIAWLIVRTRTELRADAVPEPTVGNAARGHRRRRTNRRIAAGLTATSGVVAVVSAMTAPFGSRSRRLADLLSLGLAHTATGVVAAAGVALLVLSSAVLRGQRRAWTLTVVLLAVTTAGHLVKGIDVEEATLAAVGLAFLLRTRASFTATTRPHAARHAARTMAVGLLTAYASGFVAVVAIAHYAKDSTLGPSGAADTVFDSVRRAGHLPVTPRSAGFLHAAMFGAAVATALVALWRALRPVVQEPTERRLRTDREAQVRTIVAAHGGGTLDYFILRDDKEWFVHRDTAIGYAVRFGVCLVSPDPIGPDDQRAECFESFRAFVDSQGWTLAVLAAASDWLATYASYGMRSLYVGDEAIVDVAGFTLEGGARKSLRQAVNRVARNGYRVTFHDPGAMDAALQEQLMALMAKSRRGGAERGFSMTLGRIFDPRDTGLLLAVCHGPDGVPAAFCQFVPSPAIGGWSLDLMRRDTGDHPNGLLDFVIVETIRHVAAEGGRSVGLNFATMRAVLASERGDGWWLSLQRAVLHRLSADMQIASLWQFNAKYGPRWLPRHVALDGSEHALHVAVAMAAAESLWELPVIGRWLGPVTVPAAAPAKRH